ncbi:MAG: carboxymuconolactone decarboxylase family protein [Solirubrobacteraceae bacterium]
MTFIQTVDPADATGRVAELYAADRAAFGRVPNFTQAFSLHPEAYAAWRQLNGAVKSGADLRRYELATLAAARRLRSSYCAIAHGSVLAEQFMEPEAVRAAITGHHAAGLDEADVAVMDLADQVADDATSVTQADIDRLRSLGLSDREILDVVLAAAARCFFSTVLDALGARPDREFADEVAPDLLAALTVGHPLAEE